MTWIFWHVSTRFSRLARMGDYILTSWFTSYPLYTYANEKRTRMTTGRTRKRMVAFPYLFGEAGNASDMYGIIGMAVLLEPLGQLSHPYFPENYNDLRVFAN